MKRCFLNICLLYSFTIGSSQTKFLSSGRIEYERKINVHQQADLNEDDSWFKEFIAKLPKFHTSYFSLYFANDKTVYRPEKEIDKIDFWWLLGPSKENIILTDLQKKSHQSIKSVFEDTYVLQDSIRNMEWRITDEIRNIAGFDCRKAVGKICDSVYVVAFYTDEIAVSGGPESFNNLPGMILGLAIPRLYTTWFATKVELTEPPAADFNIPPKGKKITQQNLQTVLQRSLKDWGKQGQRNIWWVML